MRTQLRNGLTLGGIRIKSRMKQVAIARGAIAHWAGDLAFQSGPRAPAGQRARNISRMCVARRDRHHPRLLLHDATSSMTLDHCLVRHAASAVIDAVARGCLTIMRGAGLAGARPRASRYARAVGGVHRKSAAQRLYAAAMPRIQTKWRSEIVIAAPFRSLRGLSNLHASAFLISAPALEP
jgi:hypothetical protein